MARYPQAVHENIRCRNPIRTGVGRGKTKYVYPKARRKEAAGTASWRQRIGASYCYIFTKVLELRCTEGQALWQILGQYLVAGMELPR